MFRAHFVADLCGTQRFLLQKCAKITENSENGPVAGRMQLEDLCMQAKESSFDRERLCCEVVGVLNSQTGGNYDE